MRKLISIFTAALLALPLTGCQFMAPAPAEPDPAQDEAAAQFIRDDVQYRKFLGLQLPQ